MSHMDYDLSQPKHTPIIVSILITMVFIFVCTFGLIYYFKGALKIQENRNEQIKGSSFSLSQLREWETEYLNLSNEDKISIDEAIHITIIRYNN